MRKIEKMDGAFTQNNSSNDMEISTSTSDDDTSCICKYCGVSISSFLLANHQRHCAKAAKQSKQAQQDEEYKQATTTTEEQQASIDPNMIARIEQSITVQCE